MSDARYKENNFIVLGPDGRPGSPRGHSRTLNMFKIVIHYVNNKFTCVAQPSCDRKSNFKSIRWSPFGRSIGV